MKLDVKHYDGCGNTFAMVRHEDIVGYGELGAIAVAICAHDALQTDGFIVVKEAPLEMIFYNRDGSQARMCGNGIRCFAKYALDAGMVDAAARNFDVLTGAGVKRIDILTDDGADGDFSCRVDMGTPDFTAESMRLHMDMAGCERLFTSPLAFRLDMTGQLGNVSQMPASVDVHCVYTGTQHAIVFAPDVATLPHTTGATALAQAIGAHALFGDGVNVNFVEVIDEKNLIVRTYERGVGWTKACGTGCCGAYVIAKQLGHIQGEATIHIELDILKISETNTLYMTGPATYNRSVTVEINL